MCLIKAIILFAILTPTLNGLNTNNNCPRFCECDSYLGLNRARCSSRRLISAGVDLPQQVQILDLSHNEITTLDNKCFANFHHIKFLNLSHNALHSIDWAAFSQLRQLTDIDLSYNRLEYLDERLFASNKFLSHINLEGNKFESLQNKPFLRNAYVDELNLRNAEINLLQPQVFGGLTNLRRLDLSQNLLNDFNFENFQDLGKLQKLNLTGNFLKCDAITKSKLQQLEQRGTEVAMANCESDINANINRDSEMFQKMIATTQQPDQSHQHSANHTNQWSFNLSSEDSSGEEYYDYHIHSKEIDVPRKNFESPDTVSCNKDIWILCREYHSCKQDLNKAWHETRPLPHPHPYSLSDLKFAFIMGLAIGVSAIVIILAGALCVKKCWEMKKLAPRGVFIEEEPVLPLPRRISQLRRRHPRRSMMRYEGPVAENFLSRLFGRPARRQYYRIINRNTSTLIRRLSQSNLFANRSNHHFVDRQSNSGLSLEEQNFAASFEQRSETPPPSYGDTVAKTSGDAS